MTTFFLDLWHDLREKRLWPVAVGLLAAIVAIPAIMLKPAADPKTPPPIAADPSARETLPAVEVDSSPSRGSKLETFSTRNPFKPMSDLEDDDPGTADGGGDKAPAGGSGGGDAGPGGDAPRGASGGSGGSSDDAPSGGGGGGGSSSDDTPSSGGGSDGGMHWFKYTADVEFGRSDRTKRLKSIEPLTILPKEETPIVVFMGVSADAKRATFFVADPSFSADGEGDCNSEECQFVSLGLSDGRNEETFTSEDGSVSYDLKLLKLRREEISETEAQGDTSDGAPKGKTGGETITEASQRVLPRLIAGPAPKVVDGAK